MVMVVVFPLRQEVGGDRPRRPHGQGTARARDRMAAAPAGEDGSEGRRRRKGHYGAAIVGGGAGGSAVDPGGTGGHGAVADAQGARLVHREGEALQGKGGGDRPRRTHGHGTARTRDRIAAAPAGEAGTCGRSGGQGNGRAARVGSGAGWAGVELGARGESG